MNILALVNNVKTLNGYSSLTEDLTKLDDYQVPFDIGMILSLKKIRSFEVDYFTKHFDNGAALILLKRILENPPSKTWGLLGKEMASLVQYWLEGVKKYLMVFCPQWWRFLKTLLCFINEITTKDPSIGNTLSKTLAETILDLASSDLLDLERRLEVLACINQFSTAASRDTLFGLQKQLNVYFSKLWSVSCPGPSGLQLAALEVLLRWLPARRQRAARARAMTVWKLVADPEAAEAFLDRTFDDFYKDSREFINILNKSDKDRTSVSCKKIVIGEVEIVSSSSSSASWLDLCGAGGAAGGAGRPGGALQLGPPATGLLLLPPDDVTCIVMHRETQDLIISLTLHAPPRLLQGNLDLSEGEGQIIKIWISTRSDIRRLDAALKDVYGDKYENKLNNGDEKFSSETSKWPASSEEEAKLSQPPKRRQAGVAVRTWGGAGWRSPSTASTTSLAQLHEKLAAFPRLRNDRAYPTVCALPELSCVTEATEFDDDCYRRASGVRSRFKPTNQKAKTSPSDEEVAKVKWPKFPLSSPAQRSPNNLLDETIGPIERPLLSINLEQDKTLDQLVCQAFQKDALLDSGINSSQVADTIPKKSCTVISKSSSEDHSVNVTAVDEVIERNITVDKKTNEVHKSSTTDESNTEAISDTPQCYVNTRRKVKVSKERHFEEIGKLKPVAGLDEMLEFFDQHFLSLQNKKSDELVISPTLAKKINASSSESSESFDKTINDSQNEILAHNMEINLNDNVNDEIEDLNRNFDENLKMVFEVHENDIISCLASMIDRVCKDLDKCTVLLDQEVVNPTIQAEKVLDVDKKDTKVNSKRTHKMPKIKLAFKKNALENRRNVSKKNKLDLEPVETSAKPTETLNKCEEEKNMDEANLNNEENEIVDVVTIPKGIETSAEPDTPFIVRRKRKLYSPKDDNEIEVEPVVNTETKGEKQKGLQTPATSYSQIEKDRKKFIRKTRNRKSRNAEPVSPRTQKKNEVFDLVKENIENERDIVLVDKNVSDKDIAVYNFTSDSSDDDFKQKKIAILKNTPRKKQTRTKKLKSEKYEPKKKERKKIPKKAKAEQSVPENIPLIDERMRHATPEILNNSYTVDESCDGKVLTSREDIEKERPDPIGAHNYKEVLSPRVNIVRVMEPIPESMDEIENTAERNVQILKVKKEKGLASKKKTKIPESTDASENTTESNVQKSKVKKGKKQTVKKNAKTREATYATDESDEKSLHILKVKKEKSLQAKRNTEVKSKITADDTDELPPLIIEVEHPDDKDNRSTISSNFEENVKKIIRGEDFTVDITNTTHNLLSEADRFPFSPAPIEEADIIEIQDKQSEVKDAIRYSQRSKKHSQETRKSKPMTSQPQVIVDITSEINERQSERSISTIGGNSPITAHGDFDEAPPSPEMLNQIYSPRNLELQNLSEFAKECNTKLRDRLNCTGSDETEDTHCSDVKRLKSLSPVVSLRRLSAEDISKWLPSPKSSMTDDTEIAQLLETKRVVTEKRKTPEVKNKASKAKNVKATKKAENNEIVTKANKKSTELKVTPKKTEYQKKGKPEKSQYMQSMSSTTSALFKQLISSPKLSGTARRSVISPINLDFDDFIPTLFENKSLSEVSSKILKRQISEASTQNSNNSQEVIKSLRREPSSSTANSDTSKVTQIRKFLSTRIEESPQKKRKLQVSEASGSGGADRVRHWLGTEDSSKHDDEETGNAYKECIEKVMEKLNTTLLDIHQNTSERLVHMFVLMEERQREMQSEIITKMEEMQREYNSEIRERAGELLREDCRKKRAMLSLLMEDLADTLRGL